MDLNNLPGTANKVRQQILRIVYEAGSGHLAGALSSVDIMVALYFCGFIGEKDRFVLSCGHYAPAFYSVLVSRGIIPAEMSDGLSMLGSSLQGHPHNLATKGIQTSSGPLGQGLSQAAGMALAEKGKNQVYCLMSDGEQQEGQVWEALMFGAKYKLDNLIAIVDRNGIQIDGKTEEIMPLGDLAAKYLSFGWKVFEVDGHNYNQLINVFETAKSVKGKPSVIIAKTISGKGVSFMEGKPEWHHGSLSEKQYKLAMAELI